ncbi:MAG TPA: YkvA family protein [Myxococcota bacterium]|nr:YkvA family protein [Myxococcota bacterium]
MPRRRPIQPQERSRSWKDQAEEILIEVRALYLASRDPRTPLLAKLVAVFVASYFASPIQLIPNWVPVIGYLDDLVVAIVGLRLIRRLIPPALTQEYLRRAREMNTPNTLPNAASALAVVGLFGLLVAMVVWTIIRFCAARSSTGWPHTGSLGTICPLNVVQYRPQNQATSAHSGSRGPCPAKHTSSSA